MALRLIVEVGSTKADWSFIDSQELKVAFNTNGYNPTYSKVPNEGFIIPEIKRYLKQTDHVCYYGAGASSVDGQNTIKAFFKGLNINNLVIETDLLAAARATCGNGTGLVSILGTGSNSGYYDGVRCTSLVPSLGYLLGDYGSGSYIGKSLLQAYFYNTMPKYESEIFRNQFGLTREKLVKELYTSKSPAQFLGKYALYLNEIEGDWKDKFLENIFIEFVDLHFYNNPHTTNCRLHLIGSVALAFKDQLIKVCNLRNIEVGEVIKSPSTKLIQYHIRNYDKKN